ncbi:TPA: hypothetical protein ACGOZH_001854 [Streptococcus suis]
MSCIIPSALLVYQVILYEYLANCLAQQKLPYFANEWVSVEPFMNGQARIFAIIALLFIVISYIMQKSSIFALSLNCGLLFLSLGLDITLFRLWDVRNFLEMIRAFEIVLILEMIFILFVYGMKRWKQKS